MNTEGLQQAIRIAGSQSSLARQIGTYPQLVQFWTRHGRVPVKWVIPIERATGVPRTVLRPDIYPPE